MRFKSITSYTVIVAVLLLALLGLYSLDRTRLGHSIPDEKRYIQSTREMAETGDYITPRYHGRLRFQKPILFYWLIMLSYKLFGVSIFGARFPSIALSLLNVILIYLLGRDLFNKKVGISSALVLSTSEVYFTYSRFAAPDITFLFFITAAIYLFVRAYTGKIKGPFKYLYMYVFMALAMLTKGPLGFLYPLMIICLFLVFKKEWATFKELKFVFGFLIFIAISVPWFVVMIFLHGSEYIDKVWFLEIVKKLKYIPSEANSNILTHYFKSIFYYLGMAFARYLPWTAFLPASLILIKDSSSKQDKNNSGFTLIAAWFFVVFLSLVLIWSKESYYVLSLSIPMSLFLGEYFSRFGNERVRSHILSKLPFILTIIASSTAILLWLAFIVYILDIPILSFSLLILVAPVFMVYAYFGRNKMLLPLSFFITSFVLFAYLGGYIIPTLDREESLLGISKEIKKIIKPNDVVGVASSEISYHRLNVPLRDHIIIRADKRPIDRTQKNKPKGKKALINHFLSTDDRRIFCVITKNDYYEYVDKKLLTELYIMDKTLIWKKFHKQDKEYFKNLLSYLLEGERESLKQAIKEEIYLISNSES
jgi:4-amino-4-deoxy-L-arabinose transferase-like glycosyltransferase